MIPPDIVETVNDVRFLFLNAQEVLDSVPSFRALTAGSQSLRASLADIARVGEGPHVKKPCEGRITVAIIGSSGHGKTTLLDEMFPTLSERGWLVTDVTDTTAQSLRITHAPEGSDELAEVFVRSWNTEEIKELMRHPDVEEQNAADNIRVSYLEDGVEVDGSEASFPESDLKQFRFPRKVRLRPFPAPYGVSAEQAKDRRFIRALTVKEQSQVLDGREVISMNGDSWNALQLRALVKDVSLRDPFREIKTWTDLGDDDVGGLTFVDTPGLAVNGSVKDEVLRHFLERKSDHIALQLWKNDELDIVVHLALCGRQSDFAVLWKAIERACGPAEMDDLAGRLILAVNGMNIYFTNRDIKAKYEDPEVAAREGDQFATTLEDNILQKMSPRGRVRPARVCFVDSRSIVETLTTGSYAEAYRKYRPIMESWIAPGGTGRQTLDRLGILDAFQENIEALSDPKDRGQGHLVRQIASLAREKGPALLLRKHLVKSGLLQGMDQLHELLAGYYDQEGGMRVEAVREAMQCCLGFLDRNDLTTIESFARKVLDPRIQEIVPRTPSKSLPADWVVRSFRQLCQLLGEAISDHGRPSPEVETEFRRHFAARCKVFEQRFGYATAHLTPPDKGFASSAELLTHCLKLHAREILYQLLAEDSDAGGVGVIQNDEDRDQIRNVLGMLEEGRRVGAAVCAEHGVAS
jgi:hypothetical protein